MSELNDGQIKQLAEFESNLSLLFIASSLALAFNIGGNVNYILMFSGVVLSACFLVLSLLTLNTQ